MLRVALFCRARFFFRIPIALWQKWIIPAEFARREFLQRNVSGREAVGDIFMKFVS